jgi:hypothetical protein
MHEPLSKEYLDSVRTRCEASTNGPWKASIEDRDHPLGGESVILRGINGSENDLYLFGGTVQDYDFVACARQDVPLLLDEIEQLKNLRSVTKSSEA